jgi:hypothetical protein
MRLPDPGKRLAWNLSAPAVRGQWLHPSREQRDVHRHGVVKVPPSGVTLSATPTSVRAGGSVTAAWSGIAAPTTTDWIGLYSAGAGDGAYLAWLYVSCSQTPGASRASGSCTLQVPGGVAPGVYQLRLYAANGFTRLATSSVFSVTP